MKFAADQRAKQLKEHYGFENAGVYDPESIGGTHVIYVLHDATNPEAYGGLPANPKIPFAFMIWKDMFKPLGLIVAMTGFLGALFHYVFRGPHRPQPELPVKSAAQPSAPAAGKGA